MIDIKPIPHERISQFVRDVWALSDLELSVIPIKPKSKKACVKWKKYQRQIASVAEIREFFADETRNIGIVCGRVSANLCVLDFDVPGMFEKFSDAYPQIINNTVIAKSAKGYHVYLRIRDNFCPTYGKAFFRNEFLGQTRGNGSYITCPSSTHESGIKYQWVRSPLDSEILTIDNLKSIEIVGVGNDKKRKTNVKTVTDLQSYHAAILKNALNELSVSREGNRNNTLFYVSSHLSRFFVNRVFKPNEIKEQLLSIAIERGLEMSEATATIESGFRHRDEDEEFQIQEIREDYRTIFELSKPLGIYSYLKTRVNRDTGWRYDVNRNPYKVRVFADLDRYYLEGWLACAITQNRISTEFGISQSSVSRQLTKLKELGLITELGLECESLKDGTKYLTTVYALGEIRQDSDGFEYEHFYNQQE